LSINKVEYFYIKASCILRIGILNVTAKRYNKFKSFNLKSTIDYKFKPFDHKLTYEIDYNMKPVKLLW
jgi:hypothetical protein